MLETLESIHQMSSLLLLWLWLCFVCSLVCGICTITQELAENVFFQCNWVIPSDKMFHGTFPSEGESEIPSLQHLLRKNLGIVSEKISWDFV